MELSNFSLDIGHKLDVTVDKVDHEFFEIRIERNGKTVGFANLMLEDEASGYVDDLWVEQSWRRLGIATAIYNHIEEAGITLRPSDHLDIDGALFWEDRLRKKRSLQP